MKTLTSIAVAVAVAYMFNQGLEGDASHVAVGFIAFGCCCFGWAAVTK